MTANPSTVLRTANLAVGYGGAHPRTVARGLDLALRAGSLVCLLGPNGAGKTTLLRTLAGLLPPLEGEVYYDSKPASSLTLRQLALLRSVVLTRHAGAGPLRVRETVSLGRLPFCDWLGLPSAADDQAVDRAMRTTGCEHLAHRRLSELSDGERQRVFIARAMAQESACMLLDEPTAFLDLPRRVEIVRLLVRLAHECRRAVALSTHDLDLALQTADEVWLMESDGRVHVGPPEELVLNGAFGGAFASEGIRFDPAQGRFVWREADGPPVRVVGDGLRASWTEHALRRIGFRIVGADHPATLTVEASADSVWRVFSKGEGGREHASLGSLLEAVRPRCEGTVGGGAID